MTAGSIARTISAEDFRTATSGSSSTDAPAPSGNKSYVERDKELEKSRKAAREKQEKSEKSAKSAQEAEQRCAQAKQAYQTYADGGRIYKYNEKGERTYLDDAELETERNRTRREMEEACKNM